MLLALAFQQPDYYNQTTLHPMALVALTLSGLAVLALPRRNALLPFLVMACLVSPAQRLVIGGLDFNLMRMMVLIGWLRLGLRGEYTGLRLRTLDKLIFVWILTSAVAYVLLWGSLGAATNRLGRCYDFVGMYIYLRCVLRDWRDLQRLTDGVVWMSFPVLVFFMIEKSTGRNLFSALGGVPLMTEIREGRLRCQGAFPHSILAGCFWVGLLPLVAARWWTRPRSRALTLASVVAIVMIIFSTSSSTPVGGLGAVMLGGACFSLRRHMRPIRWAVLATLIALHLVMKAPVWHLVARIDLAGGSTGWHRFLLIDQTVKHFSDWCLVGIKSSAGWGPNGGDVANQYVAEALGGGLLGLGLFIAVLTVAFRDVGRLRRRCAPQGAVRHAVVWALAVALFAHILMFIAVSMSYSPQNLLVLLLLLASVSSLSNLRPPRPAPRPQPRPKLPVASRASTPMARFTRRDVGSRSA